MRLKDKVTLVTGGSGLPHHPRYCTKMKTARARSEPNGVCVPDGSQGSGEFAIQKW